MEERDLRTPSDEQALAWLERAVREVIEARSPQGRDLDDREDPPGVH